MAWTPEAEQGQEKAAKCEGIGDWADTDSWHQPHPEELGFSYIQP
jgi:hypothetical protein